MAEILKWSFLGLGALFVLIPICYYWFLKSPIINKHIADSSISTAKKINTILQKQIYSNSVSVLVLFVIILYVLSWKFAIIFLVGTLFAITVRVLVAFFSKKINPVLLLESEKGEQGKTANILKIMTSFFVFGFAFLALFALKIIFNDINVLYALVLGIGLETFLIQIQSRREADQFSSISNYFSIFAFILVTLAATAENFYPSFQSLTLLLWAIPIAGLKIFLLSLLINFLLKKTRIFKSSEIVLPISITILLAVSFYLIPHYLFQNNQYNSLRMFASLLLGLFVAIIYHFVPKKNEEKQSIQNFLPILVLVFSMLLANYIIGYLGVALVIMAQASLFWVMFARNVDNENIHQSIISNVFGLSAILIFFLIQRIFNLNNSDQIALISSLLLGGLTLYFVVYYALLTSKKIYVNLFALLSILIPFSIIFLFGISYLIGIILGALIIGILLACIYQNAKALIYSMLTTILFFAILLKDFLKTDSELIFKIIIAGVLLISVSAFAIFKPETNE
jgi:hypothetical protein